MACKKKNRWCWMQLLKELGPGGGRVSAVQQLLDQVRASAANHACSADNFTLIGLFLLQGADPSCCHGDGRHALTVAVVNGHHDVLPVLVQRGADVDQQSGPCKASVGRRSSGGQTAYDVALRSGCRETVSLITAQTGDQLLRQLTEPGRLLNHRLNLDALCCSRVDVHYKRKISVSSGPVGLLQDDHAEVRVLQALGQVHTWKRARDTDAGGVRTLDAQVRTAFCSRQTMAEGHRGLLKASSAGEIPPTRLRVALTARSTSSRGSPRCLLAWRTSSFLWRRLACGVTANASGQEASRRSSILSSYRLRGEKQGVWGSSVIYPPPLGASGANTAPGRERRPLPASHRPFKLFVVSFVVLALGFTFDVRRCRTELLPGDEAGARRREKSGEGEGEGLVRGVRSDELREEKSITSPFSRTRSGRRPAFPPRPPPSLTGVEEALRSVYPPPPPDASF
ncbi:hypothetical protein F7725_012172 [Dissostichus mawsoni]|uniref:Uncharacterized protein n=1 Tax=Dissostichus mawsoni TaxID=36200 RepID=A0A7J5YM03_DISMA|nr:hypothetical protein F7725_012172 [Dissostichus mawsoni]